MEVKLSNNLELRNALNFVWMISALLFVLIFSVLLFFPEHLILSTIPICESQVKGGSCFLCGASRAFVEIAKLNFSTAYNFNKGSILLFAIMAINLLTYLYFNHFYNKIFKSKL